MVFFYIFIPRYDVLSKVSKVNIIFYTRTTVSRSQIWGELSWILTHLHSLPIAQRTLSNYWRDTDPTLLIRFNSLVSYTHQWNQHNSRVQIWLYYHSKKFKNSRTTDGLCLGWSGNLPEAYNVWTSSQSARPSFTAPCWLILTFCCTRITPSYNTDTVAGRHIK